MTSSFTFNDLRVQFEEILDLDYRVLTCAQYAINDSDHSSYRTLINRVDIDLSVRKAERLGLIFNELGIAATFFVRLHAKEYNPFDFENYRVLRFLRDTGHEIGYHSEIVDQAAIWGESAEDCLRRDLDVLGRMLDIRIKGVASHGGMTGLNNLDFWKQRAPQDYGLLYEAYDEESTFNLFATSRYVSDSEWVRWKSYENGVLRPGDHRSLVEHAREGPPVIYSLIHPDTYFDRHCYE